MYSGNSICGATDKCHGSGEDGGGEKYIEHPVSRLDTLAGIAIKYGVQVADIRRLNNLVTDLQIFALKTLLIPLSGRHPPSSGLSCDSPSSPNGSASARPQRGSSSILDVMQSLSTESPNQEASSAMSNLQKFFSLKPLNHSVATEKTETAVYRRSVSDNSTDAMFRKAFSLKSRKSGDFLDENCAKEDYINIGDYIEVENEKPVRRRKKMEADSRTGSSEKLSKEENNGSNSGFSSSSGNNVAMRTKSASWTAPPASPDSTLVNTIPVGLGDSLLTESLDILTNSSSSSNLQEEDRGSSLSLWPGSGWSLKPDFQAPSTSSISIPIFHSLSIPITGRRKAA